MTDNTPSPKVPADLRDRIEARHAGAPRYRVTVTTEQHPGWTTEVPATTGRGQAIAHAMLLYPHELRGALVEYRVEVILNDDQPVTAANIIDALKVALIDVDRLGVEIRNLDGVAVIMLGPQVDGHALVDIGPGVYNEADPMASTFDFDTHVFTGWPDQEWDNSAAQARNMEDLVHYTRLYAALANYERIARSNRADDWGAFVAAGLSGAWDILAEIGDTATEDGIDAMAAMPEVQRSLYRDHLLDRLIAWLLPQADEMLKPGLVIEDSNMPRPVRIEGTYTTPAGVEMVRYVTAERRSFDGAVPQEATRSEFLVALTGATEYEE